ncbi:uncharacterized protein LOC124634144 [Helicoverpa zea]|uniref:uncharacterized protein LOC124634144 n=1 Tax=Helicoverpa zea TaxID=7113 RepID=UPI001F5AB172|nr:uncharacterized protein LOC124634144 [Helicoverpa zea]
MYFKVITFMCAVSLVTAGQLLHAALPIGYHPAPAISSSSFFSHTAHDFVGTNAADLVFKSYAGIPLLSKNFHTSIYNTYGTTPIVFSYPSIYTHSTPIVYPKRYYTSPAILSYTAPIYAKSKFNPTSVSHSSIFTRSSALPYAITAPIIAKAYVIPTIAHSHPIYAKTVTPVISYTSLFRHSIPLTYAAAAPTMSKTYTIPSYVRKTVPSAVSYSSDSTHSPSIDCEASHDVDNSHEEPIVTKFSAAPEFKSVKYTSVVDK